MTQLFVNMTDETKQLMAAADSAYSAFLDSRIAYAREHESFYTWLESHLGPEHRDEAAERTSALNRLDETMDTNQGRASETAQKALHAMLEGADDTERKLYHILTDNLWYTLGMRNPEAIRPYQLYNEALDLVGAYLLTDDEVDDVVYDGHRTMEYRPVISMSNLDFIDQFKGYDGVYKADRER